MACLQRLYDENAALARQHETQREVLTNICLPVAAVLIGLVTYAGMSIWSLPAAMFIAALGVYGLLFSGKHFERLKLHLAMMKEVRKEMDRLASSAEEKPQSLLELKSEVEREHYLQFVWPRFWATRSQPQSMAISWIARQRLHLFWEAAHAGIAILGLLMCLMIFIKAAVPDRKSGQAVLPRAAAS